MGLSFRGKFGIHSYTSTSLLTSVALKLGNWEDRISSYYTTKISLIVTLNCSCPLRAERMVHHHACYSSPFLYLMTVTNLHPLVFSSPGKILPTFLHMGCFLDLQVFFVILFFLHLLCPKLDLLLKVRPFHCWKRWKHHFLWLAHNIVVSTSQYDFGLFCNKRTLGSYSAYDLQDPFLGNLPSHCPVCICALDCSVLSAGLHTYLYWTLSALF